MVRINLIPARQGKKRELGYQQLVLFGLVLLIGGAINYIWASRTEDDVAAEKQTVNKIQHEITALNAAIGEVNSITKEKKDLEDKLKVLDTLKKKRVGPVKVMDSLAQVVPAHVWLTDMQEKGGEVSLAGLGMTNDDVAEFMRELKRSPYFKNIVLKKVQTQDTSGPITQVVQFQITCNVSYSA